MVDGFTQCAATRTLRECAVLIRAFSSCGVKRGRDLVCVLVQVERARAG
jgi:hypothetical protein